MDVGDRRRDEVGGGSGGIVEYGCCFSICRHLVTCCSMIISVANMRSSCNAITRARTCMTVSSGAGPPPHDGGLTISSMDVSRYILSKLISSIIACSLIASSGDANWAMSLDSKKVTGFGDRFTCPDLMSAYCDMM